MWVNALKSPYHTNGVVLSLKDPSQKVLSIKVYSSIRIPALLYYYANLNCRVCSVVIDLACIVRWHTEHSCTGCTNSPPPTSTGEFCSLPTQPTSTSNCHWRLSSILSLVTPNHCTWCHSSACLFFSYLPGLWWFRLRRWN